MEALRNNDEQVMCPYNPAHFIRKCRMDVHLVKCRKSHKNSEKLAICDFNSKHRIPEPELKYHHQCCPNRNILELDISADDLAQSGPLQPNNCETSEVPIDTSWDDDDVPTYNPQEYCESRPILRRLDTQPAAVKRNFRIAERLRFNDFDTPERGESSSAGTTNKAPVKLAPTPKCSPSSIESVPNQTKKLQTEFSIGSKEPSSSKQS
ncbi:gametocyte-specific factor 1 homolog [Euwallacea fornicatus]|uniref:gametocyte-specific factor 1 homolog n=1 Tax=Euwallacea fornicatus TaxID=995702 RepID=UPI00338D68D0